MCLNVFGLFPFSFTVTSHIIITLIFALVVFFVCIGMSIFKHGFKFLSIFVPMIVVMEIFSYLMRPMTLSLRLAANMIAGHVILDVMAYFAIMLGIAGIFPFLFLVALQIFEIAIAILQAYIFSMLSCIYIAEAKQKELCNG